MGARSPSALALLLALALAAAAAGGEVQHTVDTNDSESCDDADAAVCEQDVHIIQAKWAAAIKRISATHKEGGDFVQAAADAAGELYAYGHSEVLFKPTKAAEHQFRPTPESAMSYFVGGANVEEGGLSEDGGFAINGGRGWSECVFDNHNIVIKNGIGLAMGNYYFTCATTGHRITVEYTFGYERCADGVVRIFLHHSSVPFDQAAAATAEQAKEEL
jgi:hypothetical protein